MAAVRNVYSIIDQNGTLIQSAMSLSHGEQEIARDFGISQCDLTGYQTQRRNSKSFCAFVSTEGKFREIVGARDFD